MIQNKVNEQIKETIKNSDRDRLNVLRSLKAAFVNAALQVGNINTPIPDIKALAVIRTAIAQREDSYNFFLKGGRNELAQKELVEIEILKEFLPPELSQAEINALVEEAIQKTGASSKKDSGKVMKFLIERTAGAVDNKTLYEKVSNILR